MKTLIRLEEAAMLLLGVYAYHLLDQPWWIFGVFFLGPDIGIAGYLINSRKGAISYNFLHHKALAIICWTAGIMSAQTWLQAAGIILFSHASFDRMLGYGLKYADSFSSTHLGKIGFNRTPENV